LQSSLAATMHGAAGPLACIKVGKDPYAKTTALVNNIVHPLNAPTALREYNITRHHWHLSLLQDLHPVGSKKTWTQPLIANDAKKYNIYEQCDRFNSSSFCQSPNVPVDVVRGYISSRGSVRYDRNLRRQENMNKIIGTPSSSVTVTPLFVPSPECARGQVDNYINCMYPSPLQKKPVLQVHANSFLCGSIQNRPKRMPYLSLEKVMSQGCLAGQ
jgi:hypothetical protein